MLSSTPAYIKCYECKKSPKQFTFLLCNHIICQKCISKNIQISHKYNLIKCSCGCLTYFNEENVIVDEEENNLFKENKIIRNGKSSNLRDKITSFDRKSSPQSMEMIKQYSKTLLNERSTMPLLEVSEVFSIQPNDFQQSNNNGSSSPTKKRYMNESPILNKLCNNLTGTQMTGYEESLLLQNYQNFEPIQKNQSKKLINQFTTHCIGEQNTTPKNKQNALQTPQNYKQNINVLNNLNRQKSLKSLNSLKSTTGDSPLHARFRNEIDFINILFQKDIQEIQFQFSKVMQELKKTYLKLEESLKSLYIEQVITHESIFTLNLSDMIKQKYQKMLRHKFNLLKDHLFMPFYNFKHNQNLFPPKSPIESPLLYRSKHNSKQKIPVYNNSINSSQIIQDSDVQFSQKTMNNKKVQKFDTVEQKLQRLTTKQNDFTSKNKTQHVRMFNQNSNKRIQTENIHTSIKRKQQLILRQEQNCERIKTGQNHLSPQINYRLTEKPQRRSNLIDSQNQVQNKRRQMIYYSPPLPYCYKHLQKRQKQAKNYISYIQKLCHEKKMKNSQELFKKVKHGQVHEFKNRE